MVEGRKVYMKFENEKEKVNYFNWIADSFSRDSWKYEIGMKIIADTETPEELRRFLKSEFTNSLIKNKFQIRKLIKETQVIYDQMDLVRKTTKENSMEREMKIAELRDYLKSLRIHDKLVQLGYSNKTYFDLLGKYGGTYHDLAQILNVPYKYIIDNVKSWKENDRENPTLYELVDIIKVEGWYNKEDFMSCNNILTPFHEASFHMFSDMLDKMNNTQKREMNQKLFELFPGLKDSMMMAKQDNEGRITSLEKYNFKHKLWNGIEIDFIEECQITRGENEEKALFVDKDNFVNAIKNIKYDGINQCSITNNEDLIKYVINGLSVETFEGNPYLIFEFDEDMEENLAILYRLNDREEQEYINSIKVGNKYGFPIEAFRTMLEEYKGSMKQN